MSAKYFSGLLTNPSTTPSNDLRLALYDGISQAITAGLTNWSIVSSAHNLVSGSGTSAVIRSVFNNSLGFSFGIVNGTGTNTNVTQFNVPMSESYDTSTNVFTNVGWQNPDSLATATSTGFRSAGINPTSISSGNAIIITTTATQSQWALFITNDYLYFSIYDANTTGKATSFFVGKFINLIANPALLTAGEHPKPFGCFGINDTNGHGGPLISLGNNSLAAYHGSVLNVNTNITNSPADNTRRDAYSNISNTKTVLTPIYITRGSTTTVPNTASANGWTIGQLPNSVYSRTTNINWGDSILIDGKKYQFIGGVSGPTSLSKLPCWVEREL